MKKVPKKLQSILWSVSVDKLDADKHKNYIIHQILSLGTLEEIIWLFKTYPKNVIQSVFIEQPDKNYTPSSFNYAKNILLGLDDIDLPLESYDRNTPRNIRP